MVELRIEVVSTEGAVVRADAHAVLELAHSLLEPARGGFELCCGVLGPDVLDRCVERR